MSELTGTARLAHLALKRDRWVALACVAGFVFLMAVSASGLADVYRTAAERQSYAATFGGDPALAAVQGKPHNLETLGGILAFETGVTYSIFVALFVVLLVGRQTRGDEEAGRMELILSTAVGRHAPVAAALILACALSVVIGTGSALALIALGFEAIGSFALGAWFAGVGIFFAAVAAFTAQLSPSKRTTTGLALATLGVAWILRALGDGGDGTLTWLSPIGWGEEMRPFGDERWWPLALMLAGAAALVAATFAVLARRDLEGGVLATRPGPAHASPALATPHGLALRLLRPSLIAWVAGIALLGLVYGAITDSIETFVEDNEQIAEILASAGGASLLDSYLATAAITLALIASGFAVQAALRLRGEENAGRLEPVLAGAVSRQRVAAAFASVSAGGSAVLAVVVGLSVGVGAALSTGDAGDVPRLVGAAFAQLPAMWLIGALGLLAAGAAPRLSPLAWAALVGFAAIEMFGELIGLPDAVTVLSPFEHTPAVPAEPVSVLPLLVLAALAAALAALGIAGFRRRDAG